MSLAIESKPAFANIRNPAIPASLITVVTVVYNAAKTIRATIDSILTQNYPNLEFIVIDGGSTDGTLEIIYNYRSHISKLISGPDKGIYDAMNKALSLASGEWIVFMNAGDRFFDQHALTHISSLLRGDSCVVLGACAIQSGHTTTFFRPRPLGIGKMPACHQSILVRTSIAQRILFDIKYRVAADYDMLCKIQSEYPSGFLLTDYCIASVDPNGYSSTNEDASIREYRDIVKAHFGPGAAYFWYVYTVIRLLISRPIRHYLSAPILHLLRRALYRRTNVK